LLSDPAVCLVTLTGTGGVGKTRLLMRIVDEMAADFRNGICFVSLASIGDPGLVATTIAQALNVREHRDEALLDRVTRAIGGEPLLLVLDNFEQVVDAAPFVTDLLTRCDRLKIVVSSRVRLRLNGEWEYVVAPLPSSPGADRDRPAGDRSGQPPPAAVQLFVERAQAVSPDFALTEANAPAVAAICARLDGLPLAIELAATRIKVLSPQAMLARLEQRLPLLSTGPRNAPARQRTMRDAIAWSYDLLGPAERIVFQRLSAFAGEFSLDAAEAVLPSGEAADAGKGPALPAAGMLDLLASVAEHSLIRPVTTHEGIGVDDLRFKVPETVRAYAQERLAASGEEPRVRQRHAAWFLALAERAEARLEREVNAAWLDHLEIEHGNLREVLLWTTAPNTGPRPERDTPPGALSPPGAGDPAPADLGLRLAGALWLFWYFHSHLSEGRYWLTRALAASTLQTADRAKALVGLGTMTHAQGDEAAALRHLTEGLALWRALGDAWGTAFALSVRGTLAEDDGSYTEATSFFREAHDLFASTGDRANVVATLYHLGVVAYGQGNNEQAAANCEEALAISRAQRDPWVMANALAYLGLIRCGQHDLAAAAIALDEALALYRQIGNTERIAEVFRRFAVLAVARGDPARAIRLFAAADSLATPIGSTEALPERTAYVRAASAARLALDAEAVATATAIGHGLTLEQATTDARSANDDPGVIESVAPSPPSRLSARQLEILLLLAEGHSDRAIADLLFISHRTVSGHVASILGKLELPSRTAAAAFAIRHGLV